MPAAADATSLPYAPLLPVNAYFVFRSLPRLPAAAAASARVERYA